MISKELPKVLVVGINAWREDGTAHTLMDIFRCWDPARLALIYTRADLPNSEVCNNYFQISESSILSNIHKPWVKTGRTVKNAIALSNDIEAEKEHERYTVAHKKNFAFLPLLREILWKLGGWKSPQLKQFVKDFQPDIIFIPIYPVAYMGRIQKYISKLTKKPTVCYLADDNYSYDSCKSLWHYIHRMWLRKHVGPLARNCKQMFVIVDKEKEDTDKRFGTDSLILTKGIDFSNLEYSIHKLNTPLKFVYTGNLLIGRDNTLSLVAKALNKINQEKGKILAELFIYSQTTPTEKMREMLDNGSSHFCGKISREEVKKVQENADVVIFAEGLVGRDANAAKLSFSTKITDYMGAGKCILAIGKEDIAPIEYFKKYNAALIAHTYEEIEDIILKVIDNPNIIQDYGIKAFNTAKKNHDKDLLNKRFIDAFKLISEN